MLASFFDRLKEKKDNKGCSLFDTTLVSFGSTLRWGHLNKNIPLILAGDAAQRMRRGEYVELPKENTPLSHAHVWLTLLQEVGVPVDRFGQSTGTVPEIVKGAS
jgi:hypothetical protein